jgi:hypothetical protein
VVANAMFDYVEIFHDTPLRLLLAGETRPVAKRVLGDGGRVLLDVS